MSQWHPATPGLVRLPGVHAVRARALRRPADAVPAQWGLYLTARPHTGEAECSRWVRWRDFRLPDAPDDLIDALHEAYARAATSRVEIACTGGIGRTGTALALLARIGGVPAYEAVAWTRTHYHRSAVETPGQRRFVRRTPLSPRTETAR